MVNKSQVRRYNGGTAELVSIDLLEDKKDMVKFFGRQNNIIEVKELSSG